MKQSIRNFIGALTFAAMTFSGTAFGAEDPIYTSFFSNAAAGGYDVTSYFGEEGEEVTPVKGDKAFSTEYQGANWLFASQENLDKFVANPASVCAAIRRLLRVGGGARKNRQRRPVVMDRGRR